MFCTPKTAINKKLVIDTKDYVSTTRKLIASWQKVDGKLVCRWVRV